MQYFNGLMVMDTPEACIIDTTPPVFAGIASVTPNVNGSITASWVNGTTTKGPLKYYIYCSLGTVNASSLFVNSNIVSIVQEKAATQNGKIWTIGDLTTYLVNGVTYTIGVRSYDTLGYNDSNTAILTTVATGSGNLPQVYQDVSVSLVATESLLSQDHLDLAADLVILDQALSDIGQEVDDLVLIGDSLSESTEDLGGLISVIQDAFIASSSGCNVKISVQSAPVVKTSVQSSPSVKIKIEDATDLGC